MPLIYLVIKGTEFLSIIETLKTPFKVMFLLEMQAAQGSVDPPYGGKEWGGLFALLKASMKFKGF